MSRALTWMELNETIMEKNLRSKHANVLTFVKSFFDNYYHYSLHYVHFSYVIKLISQLHAEYHEDDMYLAHRVLQAYSTAEFVKLTSSSADISILAGDLNTAPGDLSYR